jgi:hypothetical protein
MRTINAESKPFGLCSEEVKEELRPYGGTEAMEIYHNGWQFKKEPFFNNSATYRVQIPDEPKRRPLDSIEWLEVSKVYVDSYWRSVLMVGETDLRLAKCLGHFTFEGLSGYPALDLQANEINLYKFEGE